MYICNTLQFDLMDIYEINERRIKQMNCDFCRNVFDIEQCLPDSNCLIHDERGFHIQAVTADPYDGGRVDDIRYCPYCGRDLKEYTVSCESIIHCKDCGYYNAKKFFCYGLPTEPAVFRYPDDYCSKGILRKEN